MARRYDVLALSLLMFSTVLVIAISMDPKGFTLSTWQPLLAAITALGGAGIVYRGARLAYEAAMAKVALDRELNEREHARVTLGVLLRLEFSLRELKTEIETERLRINPPNWEGTRTLQASDFTLAMGSRLDEAWANLDRLPRQLSTMIAGIRAIYFDYKVMLRINEDQKWSYRPVSPPKQVRYFGEIFDNLHDKTVAALERARTAIDNVR
ncbi:hypothetical protein [Bradyrhizobium sp. JYMT SZCCT0428]|uniref:hypothetical protein n=1 Tax=Bradyrhizobium sp. JYMT SZCCT0428 TaxID=2807673 RepID=UPI001BA59592|nr:hypothetical protein [Bradyrhizobium sp. JYMT SZCCT0428]MBR1150120.1 hypothetical protein [Bradyrhizobium sp. JYMT SZCCT0428]